MTKQKIYSSIYYMSITAISLYLIISLGSALVRDYSDADALAPPVEFEEVKSEDLITTEISTPEPEQTDSNESDSNETELTYDEIIQQAADFYGVDAGLIKGISVAESSFGKNFVGCEYSHNWWGIKASPAEDCNRWLKKYDSFKSASMDIARILKEKYIDRGLTTPEQICPVYVGHYSQNWVNAVNSKLQ